MTLSRYLPSFSQAKAANDDYTSSAQATFSQERENANQTIARAPEPHVVKVRDHVYTAVSYALAAMIMVETPEGLVIIDTTESLSAAKIIMAEFRKISNKRVKAVIYTHNH